MFDGALLSLAATALVAIQEPVEFRLDLTPGERIVQSVQFEWADARRGARTVRKVGATMSITVLDESPQEGGTAVELRGERLWFLAEEGESPWPNYDSAETDDPPPVHLPWEGTALASLLNHTVRVEFGADGTPRRVLNWQAPFDEMIASFRTEDTMTESQVDGWRRGYESMLLTRVVAPLRLPFPPKAVDPGETWSDERSAELGTVASEFSMSQAVGDKLVVEVAGSLRRRNGSEVTQAGVCVVDRRTGWLLSRSVEQGAGTDFVHRITVTTEQPWAAAEAGTEDR